jgi:hypothetical protein
MPCRDARHVWDKAKPLRMTPGGFCCFECGRHRLLAPRLYRYCERREGEAVRASFFAIMASAVVLGGCASRLSNYVRTDGTPINTAQEQATLAQCKGEGVIATSTGDAGRLRGEQTITDARMAPNGYIQHQ